MTLKDSVNIASSTFQCDLCSYENTTKKGLNCHIAQKHKEKQKLGIPSAIPQLDGTSDDEKVILRTGTATSKTDDPSVKICKVCKMNTSLCPLSPGCQMEELIRARQELASLQAEAKRRSLL